MRTLLIDRTGREVANFEVPDEVTPFLKHVADRRPLILRQKRDEHFLQVCGISTTPEVPGLDTARTFRFFEFDEATATAVYVEA
jgi:hypothetical protein